MIDFCVILNDQIFHCSNELLYPKFELVVFSNQLVKQIADGRSWRLHKLILQPKAALNQEKILIRRFLSSDGKTELLLCIMGNFENGATFGYEIIDNLFKALNKDYCLDNFPVFIESKADAIKSLCELLSANHLGSAYEDLINSQAKHEIFLGNPQPLYSGISVNGLPILSMLYDNQQILNVKDHDKRDLITTLLSGQLATISANAYIRADCFVDSIQIKISPFEDRFIFFNFAQFGFEHSYNFEFLTSGDPEAIGQIKQQILEKLKRYDVFSAPFGGGLKMYQQVRPELEQISF